jgi:hypothetical protein
MNLKGSGEHGYGPSASIKGDNYLIIQVGEGGASEIPGIYIYDINYINKESLLLTV